MPTRRRSKGAASKLLSAARDGDSSNRDAIAAILARLGPEDPQPEDMALAGLLAFALQDWHAIRELLKTLVERTPIPSG